MGAADRQPATDKLGGGGAVLGLRRLPKQAVRYVQQHGEDDADDEGCGKRKVECGLAALKDKVARQLTQERDLRSEHNGYSENCDCNADYKQSPAETFHAIALFGE